MDLSIIIINYRTLELTLNCVKSIVKNYLDLPFEIILIDNASGDNSVVKLRKLVKKFKKIRLIENKSNLGFGIANNQGMKIARGKFILLLNSDTLISKGVLDKMLNLMKNIPEIGISSCLLKNKDGSIQGTGGYFPNLFRVFSWMFFLEDVPFLDRLIKPFHPLHSRSPLYKGLGLFSSSHEQDWLTGAFFLIRRKVIDEIGYFDEDFFMYGEDVDYCYRAKKAGWKIYYNSDVSITHLGGASSSASFPILSEFEGIKLFYKKHKASWQYPILRFFLKCGALLRSIIFFPSQGKRVAEIYAKAFLLV